MRRGICLLVAVILCFALVSPAFATQSTFVPSITYKPTPEIKNAALVIPKVPDATLPEGETQEPQHEDVQGCIVITSITQAEEKATDIHQEDRDLLMEVYAKLSDGSMNLFAIPDEYFEDDQPQSAETGTADEAEGTAAPEAPNMGMTYENKNYVVIQLVDVSFQETSCIKDEHLHKETLEREDVNITVDFDLGVSEDAVVLVLHFHSGKWEPITSTVNNGDGTVTCVFEHFCPVAFCIEAEDQEAPQQSDYSWLLWLVVLVACAAAVAVLVIYREKNKKKRNNTEE